MNEPRRYELSCRVDAYRSGWTLHAFLTHRFRYHPEAVWRERLAEGVLRVNGEQAGADTLVNRDDLVEYTVWHAEPEVDLRYDVLYEDDHLLAVNKSGNLPVHAGGKFIDNTLIRALRQRWGDELRLAHRLDRETSGVVVVSKSVALARAMEEVFRERRVKKAYLAVLRGRTEPEFRVDAPIARREPAEPPYFRVVDPSRGKPSITSFVRLATARLGAIPEGEISLVGIRPESGRTNQIRVHAAHVGHPVLGDKIYGIDPKLARRFVDEGELPEIMAAAGAPRHLLHCAELAFGHPVTGQNLRISAAPPTDFTDLAPPSGGGSPSQFDVWLRQSMPNAAPRPRVDPPLTQPED